MDNLAVQLSCQLGQVTKKDNCQSVPSLLFEERFIEGRIIALDQSHLHNNKSIYDIRSNKCTQDLIQNDHRYVKTKE